MKKEATLQAKIIKYLKSKGCYVAKMQAGPGVPVGTADIFFCIEGFYGWIECKASKTAKFQPLQREFIEKMRDVKYIGYLVDKSPLKIYEGKVLGSDILYRVYEYDRVTSDYVIAESSIIGQATYVCVFIVHVCQS